MIITLTLNPSIDRTVELAETLVRGAVHRLPMPPTDVAAGKGVNVARTLSAAGIDSRAVVMADTEDPFSALLDADRVPALSVPTRARVRVNLAIIEPDGTTTKLNEPGAPITEETRFRALTTIAELSGRASWLVIAGSLPAETDADIVVAAIEAAREANPAIRIAVDSSGDPLFAAVNAGGVDLIKPNDEELTELLKRLDLPGDVLADAAGAAALLVEHGVGTVLLTLGSEGAVLADSQRVLSASPPPTRVRSTVGAGDASLAGWLIADARGEGAERKLATAIAYGSAAAALPGTGIPSPAEADPARVKIRPVLPNTISEAKAEKDHKES